MQIRLVHSVIDLELRSNDRRRLSAALRFSGFFFQQRSLTYSKTKLTFFYQKSIRDCLFENLREDATVLPLILSGKCKYFRLICQVGAFFLRLLYFTPFLHRPAAILSCRPAFHFAREIFAVRVELTRFIVESLSTSRSRQHGRQIAGEKLGQHRRV